MVAGEDENLEEKLDSHEFRREPGDGEPVFGRLPFVTVFSVDILLAYPGLLFGVGFGEEG